MSNKQIELTVTFQATYRDHEDPVPASEVTAVNNVQLLIPFLDSKFVVFPKMLEGVTDRVITELGALVAEYYRRKTEQEKAEQEEAFRPSLFRTSPAYEEA